MTRPPRLRTREELLAAPRQTRSLEKRAKLLDAARTLFAERGYDATSIQDITSRASTAAGAFYTYFRSKRQLLVVLMNELVQRLSALDLQPMGTPNVQTGLRRFLAGIFRTDIEYFGVIRAWQEATLTDADLGRKRKELEAWTEARILRVFHQLQKYPHACAGRDLPTFARMMDRHFWSLLARGANMTERDFEREIRTAADVIYHYLFHNDTKA